ncbi:uncharacterized protein LOC118193173, partial [Stegodyphus dumicola]|uniref:uncharacterized protein LOC118193173 n=1 Tax=Stegodyphus dumicola TaxID=202533 RepID=UPI0015AD1679
TNKIPLDFMRLLCLGVERKMIAIRIGGGGILQARLPHKNFLLNLFVVNFGLYNGKRYISHNVHGLLHTCEDVKMFWLLENYSTFKFESYISSIKKLI